MRPRDLIAICQSEIVNYPQDCAGFVRAVAAACGVYMFGNANTIVALLATGRPLADGVAAGRAAAAGQLVLGGKQGNGHGHVVVVVDGPLNRGRYPYAFWGQYHGLTIAGLTANVGFTRGHGTVNYAFDAKARDEVRYAAFQPIDSVVPAAPEGKGVVLPVFT